MGRNFQHVDLQIARAGPHSGAFHVLTMMRDFARRTCLFSLIPAVSCCPFETLHSERVPSGGRKGNFIKVDDHAEAGHHASRLAIGMLRGRNASPW